MNNDSIRYKHIHVVKVGQKPKTGVWSVRNNASGDELGRIEWYGAWRQYCFIIDAGAFDSIFSAGCLADIQDFIGKAKKL